jgi:hypothetical protein
MKRPTTRLRLVKNIIAPTSLLVALALAGCEGQPEPGSTDNAGTESVQSAATAAPVEPTLPRAIANWDGRLEVFVLDRSNGGALYHKWQLTPGGSWSGWASLGGVSRSDFVGPAVARNGDGRLEAFTMPINLEGVQHLWQTTKGGGWSAWQSLGGGGSISFIEVAQNWDNRLEVFRLGADHRVYHAWQRSTGGWSDWSSLNSLSSQQNVISTPVVERNKDGRLEAFSVADGNRLFHIWQVTPGAAWVPKWAAMNSDLTFVPPAVAQNEDGRLEVFMSVRSHDFVHNYQLSPGGSWSGWFSLGGSTVAMPAVGQNADGRLEAFEVDTNSRINHIWQVTKNGGWSGWASLFSPAVSERPTVARNQDGRLELFVVAANGRVMHAWQRVAGGWSGWADL